MDELQRRFLRLVSKVTLRDECWEWQGYVSKNGYGRFSLYGKKEWAHRASLRLFRPEEPISGKVVRHRCHNKKCVNPEHLCVGTHKDNAQDSLAAGITPRGDRLAKKLSSKKVEAIRYLLARGYTQQDIADIYGVSQTMISRIARGAAWV